MKWLYILSNKTIWSCDPFRVILLFTKAPQCAFTQYIKDFIKDETTLKRQPLCQLRKMEPRKTEAKLLKQQIILLKHT